MGEAWFDFRRPSAELYRPLRLVRAPCLRILMSRSLMCRGPKVAFRSAKGCSRGARADNKDSAALPGPR